MPRCHSCQALIPTDQMHRTPYGENVCWTCFDREFIHCNECGRPAWRGDCPNDDLCYECWDRIRFWNPAEVSHFTSIKKTGSNRCFGVELETSDCDDYHELHGKTCFGVKEDGSVDGMEFYSPILCGDKGLAEIRKFCRLAKRHHFHVDDNCGYHLHIDMRDTTIVQRKHIAYAYRLTFSLWQHLVREDRWHNTFCESPNYSARELRDTHNFTTFERRQCRYQFVNLRAFCDHSTYELRGFQGTLDAREICNWIKAHLRFVDFVKDMPLAEIDAMFGQGLRKAKQSLRKVLGASLSNYYAKLWRKHAARVAV